MLSASPQPDAGQRHQVLRPRRRQARRRHRGRHRGAAPASLGPPTGARRRAGRVDDRPRRRATSRHLRRPPSVTRWTGCKVVLDCAERCGLGGRTAGAASRPGAEVVAIHAEPDGAQHQRRLRVDAPGGRCRRPCSPHGADAGFAFDGDADRCLAVDADGRDRRRGPDPGDPGARDARGRHACKDDTVVATVMSNLGFVHRHARGGHRGRRGQGRGPLRAGGDAAPATTHSAASSRAT